MHTVLADVCFGSPQEFYLVFIHILPLVFHILQKKVLSWNVWFCNVSEIGKAFSFINWNDFLFIPTIIVWWFPVLSNILIYCIRFMELFDPVVSDASAWCDHQVSLFLIFILEYARFRKFCLLEILTVNPSVGICVAACR